MKYFEPTNEKIHILGRTAMRSPLPLFWTGSGLEIRTDSGELWFDVESGFSTREEWIRIEQRVLYAADDGAEGKKQNLRLPGLAHGYGADGASDKRSAAHAGR